MHHGSLKNGPVSGFYDFLKASTKNGEMGSRMFCYTMKIGFFDLKIVEKTLATK